MPDLKLTDVDSKQIADAARAIAEDIQTLKAINSLLAGTLMNDLGSFWQGPAKQSFDMKFAWFRMSFAKFIDDHQKLNDSLKTSGQTYERTEEPVRRIVAARPK